MVYLDLQDIQKYLWVLNLSPLLQFLFRNIKWTSSIITINKKAIKGMVFEVPTF